MTAASQAPAFEPTWESLRRYRVPQWYQDAKFGIFIHWGVFSVPAFANEWYPRNMYIEGTPEFAHHRATYGSQTRFGYKDFIPRFTAGRFDPDSWARLFQEAGARYVIPVAEHHDGFALYDCPTSRWTAMHMGPRRDLIADLAAAIRRQGLIFGLSSHRAEHWWFFNGGRQFPSDVQDHRYADLYGPAQPQETQPDAAFLDDWLARTDALVDRYRPEIVYFDWWIEQPAFGPYLQRMAARFYNQAARSGREVVITYKEAAFPDGAAVYDVERGKLAAIRRPFWQGDTSISRSSWCYVEPQDYKPAGELIQDLVDVVSKNGALLLNIGPRADGTIPEAEQAILRQIGAWLAINGEAIYGTRPWSLHGEGPTEVREGKFTEGERSAFTSQDVRFTSRDGALYAICLGWPEPELTIRSLGSGSELPGERIAAISLLGTGEPLQWSQHERGLIIRTPARRPCEHAYSFKIQLNP
jgi:alpha-L-fucosidase